MLKIISEKLIVIIQGIIVFIASEEEAFIAYLDTFFHIYFGNYHLNDKNNLPLFSYNYCNYKINSLSINFLLLLVRMISNNYYISSHFIKNSNPNTLEKF
jgi:hypothetical protein